jgi:hypothetical protein
METVGNSGPDLRTLDLSLLGPLGIFGTVRGIKKKKMASVEKCEAPPERGRRNEELADGHSPLPTPRRGGREAGRRDHSTHAAGVEAPEGFPLNVEGEAIEWFPTTSLNRYER